MTDMKLTDMKLTDMKMQDMFQIQKRSIGQFHAWTLGPSISCPSFSVNPSITLAARYESRLHGDEFIF